jgi:hypothetical protein
MAQALEVAWVDPCRSDTVAVPENSPEEARLLESKVDEKIDLIQCFTSS